LKREREREREIVRAGRWFVVDIPDQGSGVDGFCNNKSESV
jgi:hypothetical protein